MTTPPKKNPLNRHSFGAEGEEKLHCEASTASRWLCKIDLNEGWNSALHGPPRKIDLACQIEAQGGSGGGAAPDASFLHIPPINVRTFYL
ncbi:hypothetical protein NEPTK9_001341 [Candidatus Neptunochlamydia vexilliferae]|uniref:Uncharacterized protein n=1 Tax=Candidatus Neptunichlamydia vexilliferae TaxID=1651774 RepID=A0ABS0B0A4_9BACT|nr:hypothetical protein [Candidatus Neptunochlamydia vexilliferae]